MTQTAVKTRECPHSDEPGAWYLCPPCQRDRASSRPDRPAKRLSSYKAVQGYTTEAQFKGTCKVGQWHRIRVGDAIVYTEEFGWVCRIHGDEIA